MDSKLIVVLALSCLALGEVAFSRSALRDPSLVLQPTGPNATLDTAVKYTPNGIGQPNSTSVIPHEEWATKADDGGVIALPVTDADGANEAFFGIPKGVNEETPERVAGADPIQPL